jgi:hypothetical protein
MHFWFRRKNTLFGSVEKICTFGPSKNMHFWLRRNALSLEGDVFLIRRKICAFGSTKNMYFWSGEKYALLVRRKICTLGPSKNVLGPVPGVDVMAKRSQGWVKCEDRLPYYRSTSCSLPLATTTTPRPRPRLHDSRGSRRGRGRPGPRARPSGALAASMQREGAVPDSFVDVRQYGAGQTARARTHARTHARTCAPPPAPPPPTHPPSPPSLAFLPPPPPFSPPIPQGIRANLPFTSSDNAFFYLCSLVRPDVGGRPLDAHERLPVGRSGRYTFIDHTPKPMITENENEKK